MSKFLIIGLGNCGAEYKHTRHNIGFDVVHAFVTKYGGIWQQNKLAYTSRIKWKGRIFFCILPTTYMNASGTAVKYWMEKEKIALENTLTVVDDLALPLAALKLKPTGSDGGHNGLKSIQTLLSTTAYAKLRFGIGNNFQKGMQVNFVLGKWLPEEQNIVNQKIERAVEAIELFATLSLERTMNLVNTEQ